MPPGRGRRGAYERLAAAGRVDGFLLSDVEVDDPRFALLGEAGVPVVVAGRPVSPCPFPWVETDHAEGMRRPSSTCSSSGTARSRSSAARADVRARAGAARGVARDAGGGRARAGPVAHAADASRGARALLDGPPTAIVYTSDALAAAVVAAARERGTAVPGELSMTGFDDSPLAALASPPLTSVRVDYAEFGAAAAAALLAAIAGEPPRVHPVAAAPGAAGLDGSAGVARGEGERTGSGAPEHGDRDGVGRRDAAYRNHQTAIPSPSRAGSS